MPIPQNVRVLDMRQVREWLLERGLPLVRLDGPAPVR